MPIALSIDHDFTQGVGRKRTADDHIIPPIDNSEQDFFLLCDSNFIEQRLGSLSKQNEQFSFFLDFEFIKQN